MRKVVALCAIGVVGGAAACSRPQAQSVSPAVPTVAVAKVTRGDVSQVLTVAAEFRPFQEIDVHAKVAGFVKSINVDVGDRVQRRPAARRARGSRAPGRTAAGRGGRQPRARKRSTAPGDDLERARVGARGRAPGRRRDCRRVLKARPNLVAQQDIDEATGRDRVAEAQVATAKAALASAQRAARGGQGRRRARRRRCSAYTRITAPFAGVITHRYADTGAMIQAGTASQTQAMPLVKLSQNNLLRLIIPVPESAVPRIHLGAAGRRRRPGAGPDASPAPSRDSPTTSRPRYADDGDRSRCAESRR